MAHSSLTLNFLYMTTAIKSRPFRVATWLAARWRSWTVWLCAMLMLLFGFAWYLQSPTLNGRVARILDSQSRLLELTVTELDGTPLALSQFRGKPLLLDFWASWCPPCRISMPELVQLQSRYANTLNILAVNIFESTNVGREYAESSGYPLRFVFGSELAEQLQIEVLPSKVLLNAEGDLIWAGIGHIPLATHQILESQL